jgi:hypothetical protein
MVWHSAFNGFKEEYYSHGCVVPFTLKKMNKLKALPKKGPALTTNQILQVLTAELEKQKTGPEEEKWVMPNEPASLMAETSVERVALVAANLSRNDLPAHECVIKAYEIIHWAAIGRGFLMGNPHERINRWTALVIDCIRRAQSDEMETEEESALSYVEWDKNEKPKPIPFIEALKAIDPKGKNNAQRKLRIEKWLYPFMVKSQQEAKSKILSWERNASLPFTEFNFAFYSFRHWLKIKTREERSKVKKDALAKEKTSPHKKTTQRGKGRVRRSTDRRLGARRR